MEFALWIIFGFFGGVISYRRNNNPGIVLLHALSGPFYFIYAFMAVESEAQAKGITDELDRGLSRVVNDSYEGVKRIFSDSHKLKVKEKSEKIKSRKRENQKIKLEIKALEKEKIRIEKAIIKMKQPK